MKIYMLVLLLMVIASSCCRQYHCVGNRGLDVVFIGYSKNVRDSVVLFFYEKNNLFNHVIDSVKQPFLFFDTTSTLFIQSLNYDYALKVVADTFYVSNLEQKITTYNACFGERVKMGECSLLDTYIVNGDKVTKSGRVITITK